MINSLQKRFKSITKTLEVLYLIEGIKPSIRIMVPEEEIPDYIAFFKLQNLAAILSEFKILKTEHDAYSNKGIKVKAEDERKGHFFLYAAKDKKQAEQLKHYEAKQDHTNLGIALGYPECCSKFFAKYAKEQEKKNNDYILPTLKESEGFQFPFQNNIAIRFLDITLLSHFPCNFHCKASKTIADKHIAIINKYDKELKKIFEGMLKGAVLYTEDQGIYALRDTTFHNNLINYKGIMASQGNSFYDQLKAAEHIEIINKHHIKVKDKELPNIGFMLFT